MRDEKSKNLLGEYVYDNERYLHEDNPWDMWDGMPHYDPKKAGECYLELEIEFTEEAEIERFFNSIDVPVTDKTKSTWFPQRLVHKYKERYVDVSEQAEANMPKYPIYIPSKTRWDVRLTSDTLIRMGVKHYMIVEQHQLAEYQKHVDPEWVTLLVLPQKYLDEYETCDDLGDSRSKGPGSARNFAWDHSISLGYKRHWVMDDNQNHFYRHDGDKRTVTLSPAIFRAMEDHSDRYENCYISGPHYRFFVVPHDNLPPFVQNCRIYSTLLIQNDIPYRWRGRYNEDTDLSLRVLKDGHCTIQYNAFTTGKLVTQAVKGGNTEEFYAKEGTLPKSQMIEDLHPDVAKVKWMNKRWHHYVDYSPFRVNRLKETDTYRNPDAEYGMEMKLLEVKNEE